MEHEAIQVQGDSSNGNYFGKKLSNYRGRVYIAGHDKAAAISSSSTSIGEGRRRFDPSSKESKVARRFCDFLLMEKFPDCEERC